MVVLLFIMPPHFLMKVFSLGIGGFITAKKSDLANTIYLGVFSVLLAIAILVFDLLTTPPEVEIAFLALVQSLVLTSALNLSGAFSGGLVWKYAFSQKG